MQPLISVDHESRHNHSHNENDQQPSENTPLLRFPQTANDGESNTSTTVIVSMLLIILIAGVVIGIYLLVVQNDSENVLPPVETPMQMVLRRQWDPNAVPWVSLTPFRAHTVIIVQTDTSTCSNLNSCIGLLSNMQNSTVPELPYNFLVSSNGQTFEALGWNRLSPLFPQYPSALVLAFIGNFTTTSPTSAQIVEAKNLIAESVSLQRLDASFDVIGKPTKDKPNYLFDALKILPHWNSTYNDA